MEYELMKPDNSSLDIGPEQLHIYKYLERKLKLKKALPQKHDGKEARSAQKKAMSAVQKGIASVLIGGTILSVALILITGDMLWMLLLFLAMFVGLVGFFELEQGKEGLGALDDRRRDQYEYMKKLIERDGIEKIYMDYRSADKLFQVSRVGKEYLFVKGMGVFDLNDLTLVDVYISNGNSGRIVQFNAEVRLRKGAEYTYSLLGQHSTKLSEKKLMAKKEMIMSRRK